MYDKLVPDKYLKIIEFLIVFFPFSASSNNSMTNKQKHYEHTDHKEILIVIILF